LKKKADKDLSTGTENEIQPDLDPERDPLPAEKKVKKQVALGKYLEKKKKPPVSYSH
jgi:hypothetical protein